MLIFLIWITTSSLKGEAKEETGLTLDPASARVIATNNSIMSTIDRHYVTIFVAANIVGDNKAKV
jgi:8-oxo-dGTP diphosphatase